MPSSLSEEYHVDPFLVMKIRDKLYKYFEALAAKGTSRRRARPVVGGGTCSPATRQDWPRRIGVVDGGSNLLRLSAGYVGIAAAVGIVFEWPRVARRIAAEPELLPEDPSELSRYEDPLIVQRVADRVREAMVFELALKLLEEGLDLLVVDGPLIPYAVIAGRELPEEEARALERYRRAVRELHSRSRGTRTTVIGFVKRPRSKFLHKVFGGEEEYDHVILAGLLGEGEYFPNPPYHLAPEVFGAQVFHDREVRELVEALDLKFTFLKTSPQLPPFRVDFGNVSRDYGPILNFLYATRTRDGIPFAVAKADEEVKITRELIRQLYEDALHYSVVKTLPSDPSAIAPLMPEYGGI
ncbi:MAG: DNA double-strand break repair nuclease NurA [Desulfurococcaceae archaeon]